MANTPVRVRIAPSPTGNLHVGTARAALFNDLFARQHGGAFVVRIEDTDPTRSQKKFEENILAGLSWLGLTWDEGPDKGGPYGPYRQSERSALYTQALQHLLDANKAYVDSAADNVIRLRVEPQTVTVNDLIRGQVTTTTDSWGGDFVIARAMNSPLFHLAVVVDDAAQAITHVLRGEDHLSNTARHILLQQALGYATPQYAHLPLLLDTTHRKLSKRAGDTDLLQYRDQGFLPEAVRNFLALLGWNPKTDQEFFTHAELIEAFSFAGIQKGGAVFSLTKLLAFNKHYLRELSPAELLAAARPYLTAQGIEAADAAYWQQALRTEVSRVGTLVELAEAVTYFAPAWPADYPAERLIWKKTNQKVALQRLQQTQAFLADLEEDDFTERALEQRLLAWIDEHDLGRGETLWPARVALTGRANSPSPFEVAAVLGKDSSLARVAQAQAKLQT